MKSEKKPCNAAKKIFYEQVHAECGGALRVVVRGREALIACVKCSLQWSALPPAKEWVICPTLGGSDAE